MELIIISLVENQMILSTRRFYLLLDGDYLGVTNEEELREIYRLVANISNNINQIILHVSRDDNSFDSDIAEIKEKMSRIWQPLNFFQAKVLQLKH